VFAFAFHFGREILKDAEDQFADRKVQARTLPLQLGNRLSLIVITVTFSILILLTFLPYFLNWLNQKYLILAVLGVDWLLLYTLWSMWKDSSAPNLSRLSTILKINMFLGLIAITVGRL
jgi:geranylgeranylglycerol-phosphate geranylgeranyltransferase